MVIAGYVKLYRSERLEQRVAEALGRLKKCRLCPRNCGVDRLSGETGFCGSGGRAVVGSYNAHFGEEAPLVGEHGSGTIFFAGCNLGCSFCQNYDISRDADFGLEADPEELAGVMLELQKQGCHNINFVTPSHVVPQILESLPIAAAHGLSIPLVYNTSGYDALKTLRLLDGVIDIYMPDVKIWEPAHAATLLGAGDYPERARLAVREMHRQVGDLQLDHQDRALRGLLVRHLVMPDGIAGSDQWMEFIADLSRETFVNIMDQYRPCGEVEATGLADRMITREEYDSARKAARSNGLQRFEVRSDRFFARILR
ncbi:MAG: radical SAM protein [Desulfovibrio sp.]|nr:radical SAM protein [Desulfovibrio sp.]